LVQRVTAEVMSAVYEEDFLGFSYGFRPNRGPHNALDAVTVGIERKRVNWVLDADIRGFYDAVSHEWLVKFVEHRIGDERVLRHIRKWLNAGVLEDGKRMRKTEGTPQGSSVSPILANVYLHYAFDLWAHQWRQKKARGEVIIVRFADDIAMGFQYRDDAERFRRELEERLLRFNLELHPDKTRLLEFGRFAASNREERGEGKPETFDYLGFTHICGKTKSGKFTVLRKTMRKKMGAKLKEVKANLRVRLHEPIATVGEWLGSVLRGHFQYFGVPRNSFALKTFRTEVIHLWHKSLKRRSQKSNITWERMSRLIKHWLPSVRIVHPYPGQRLCV
jgi:group II intron reverse transcriptase/maturase